MIGIVTDEIPTINPFLKTRAFAYWSGVTPRVVIPSSDRVGIYTATISNYWGDLMAEMVEFRNSGREDISHLLQVRVSPLYHPRLFGATNTMTTYANSQSLGYAMWQQEESRWMLFGDHHPSWWLKDHPHVSATGKVASNRGRKTASAGTPTAKGGQSSQSKKRVAPNRNSPTQASKKKRTSATRASKGVLILDTAAKSPLPMKESVVQGVSTPIIKKPIRKTRAEKRTFVPPTFPIVSTSIAARVAMCKSTRNILYSEKRVSVPALVLLFIH